MAKQKLQVCCSLMYFITTYSLYLYFAAHPLTRLLPHKLRHKLLLLK